MKKFLKEIEDKLASNSEQVKQPEAKAEEPKSLAAININDEDEDLELTVKSDI